MGYCRPKLGYNTQHFEHEHKIYCAYCCKEIKPDVAWDDYDEINYYHCDCEDALKEIELLKEIRNKKEEIESLERQIPKRKYLSRKKWVIDKVENV